MIPKVILNRLQHEYKDEKMAFKFKDNWHLLVAVILSAQSTDKTVLKITKKLFKKYKSVDDFVKIDQKKLEKEIHSAGLYRSKARNIKKTAAIIVNKFNSKVPSNMKNLLSLPGVARKTANIILYKGFGKNEGIAVDTHVKRLSARLGLTKEKDPKKIELDLIKLFPKKNWGEITDQFIFHGRKICKSQNPRCKNCVLNKICPSAFKFTINVDKSHI